MTEKDTAVRKFAGTVIMIVGGLGLSLGGTWIAGYYFEKRENAGGLESLVADLGIFFLIAGAVTLVFGRYWRDSASKRDKDLLPHKVDLDKQDGGRAA